VGVAGQREIECSRVEKRRRHIGPTEQREREREREGERARGLAPTGRPRLSGTEGTQARAREAGLNGPIWAELGFSIFRDF
jgi:hypothetical protein